MEISAARRDNPKEVHGPTGEERDVNVDCSDLRISLKAFASILSMLLMEENVYSAPTALENKSK